jgi:hypothetical protein
MRAWISTYKKSIKAMFGSVTNSRFDLFTTRHRLFRAAASYDRQVTNAAFSLGATFTQGGENKPGPDYLSRAAASPVFDKAEFNGGYTLGLPEGLRRGFRSGLSPSCSGGSNARRDVAPPETQKTALEPKPGR